MILLYLLIAGYLAVPVLLVALWCLLAWEGAAHLRCPLNWFAAYLALVAIATVGAYNLT